MKYLLLISSFFTSIINTAPAQLEALKEAAPEEPFIEVSMETEMPPEPEIVIPAEIPENANEWNRIPILEYHALGPVEYRWTRTYDNFRKDLEWLYNNDYVLLSIEDFANSYFPIPAGKKPVVLTFDDGKDSHIWFEEDGSIKKETAIGILDGFYQEHPDFGRAAVFYINANPFGQPDLVEKKLEYLQNTGRQIGYHTLSHTSLNGFSAANAANILKQQKEVIDSVKPTDMEFTTLAYPHGLVPQGNLNDMNDVISVGLLVGADPAYPLYHPRGSAYRTPRIQAIDDEWLRHFGRKNNTTENQNDSERFKPFVSDGNPDLRTPAELP